MKNLLHITTAHTGKMSGLISLSTSIVLNKFCQARQKNADSICAHCYAQAMSSRYGEKFREAFAHNTEILTNRLLTAKEIKSLDLMRVISGLRLFRFEAFGDISNATQLINYFNIAKAYPQIRFALWTKNTQILDMVCAVKSKPKNLIVVQSSNKLNSADAMSPNADKLFSVYSADYAIKNNIKINCGARSCADCQRCYKHNKDIVINEMLKSDAKKYARMLNA